MDKYKKILIIQLGDIGDVVWTTPALRAIKEAYPEAKVSFIVREGFDALLKGDPAVEKIFEVKKYGGNFLQRGIKEAKFLTALRREHFDLVFDLRAGDRGAVLAYLTGAPIRVSLFYSQGVPFWRNWMFTHLIAPPPTAERIRGAAEQSLKIVKGFGIKAEDPSPRLWVSEKAREQAYNLLQREKINEQSRWITVNPFSRWAYKEWGHEKWEEILNWLWDEYKIAAVVVGAVAENERAAAIVKKCKGKVFNLAGKTNLSELLGLLSMSFLHLGVDSGPPHIAAAVGTPTVTIYGPSDWFEWAPVGERHKVIASDFDCAPCFKKGCEGQGRSRCLEELGSEKMKAVIKETLDQMPITSQSSLRS